VQKLQFDKPGAQELPDWEQGDLTAIPLLYSVKRTKLAVPRKHSGHTKAVLL
jgi:hypothetical protein